METKELKEKLQKLSSQIGKMELQRSIGQYISIKELDKKKKKFKVLGKKYMKLRKVEMGVQ